MNILVFFYSKKTVACGWKVSESEKFIDVETEDNQVTHLKKERVLFTLKLSKRLSFEELNQIKNKATELDLEEVWEVIHGYESQVKAEELANLVYGTYSDDNLVQLVYHLFLDNTFFSFKNGFFYPNERSTVIQRKIERAKKQALAEKANQVIKWINGEDVQLKSEVLKQLLSFVFDNQEKDELLEEIRSQTGFSNDTLKTRVLKALQQRNIITPLTNIPFLKSGIEPLAFKVDYNEAIFDDLPEVTLEPELISVDNKDTLDIDDAFSFKKTNHEYHLSIAISNVGPIFASSDLLKKLPERPTSIYMPDTVIHMLPIELATHLLSLKAGEFKPVMLISTVLSSEAEVKAYQIKFCKTRVAKNLSYEEFDVLLETDYLDLLKLCEQLRLIRVRNGAIDFKKSEIEVRVNEEGRIVTSSVIKTPARLVIEELMILTNFILAKFFVENELPGIFRGQQIVNKNSLDEILQIQNENVRNYKLRSVFGRSEFQVEPVRHDGLGLPFYMQATSPIRRFFDLLCQLQVWLKLRGNPTLSKKDLQHYISLSLPFLETFQLAQRDAKRYYILRYLQQERIEFLKGIVVNKTPGGYVVEIPDYELFCYVKTSQALELGAEIKLKVDTVNPEYLTLFVSHC